jgi:hypothetical protein
MVCWRVVHPVPNSREGANGCAFDGSGALGLKFNPTRAIDFCDALKVSHNALLFAGLRVGFSLSLSSKT